MTDPSQVSAESPPESPETPVVPLYEFETDDSQEIGRRLDQIGAQLNWLCENMQSLFAFVNQMGQSGGGLRGVLSALRSGGPELTNHPAGDSTKVGAE